MTTLFRSELSKVKIEDVNLSRFQYNNPLELRLESQKQIFTGTGQKNVEIRFLLHVFAIQVKGASSEFRVSIRNGGLCTTTKSQNGLLIFEDIARHVDELARYLTGEIEAYDIDEKDWENWKTYHDDYLFANALFDSVRLPSRKDILNSTLIGENYPQKFVIEGQNAYVNFSYICPPCFLIFDDPVHGEIEIFGHTYREYYKYSNTAVLV